MDLSYISSDAWQEFERRHPDGYAFLLHESLKGELASLRRAREREHLQSWEADRLIELEELERRTS